jgi:tetratricopeptide (TPR) repeat protein
MYALGPETKVFLDGRLLHYPKSVIEDYRALKAKPDRWREISEKYSFEWAMLAHSTGEFAALIKTLWKDADWKAVYADSVVIIFVKKTGVNARIAEAHDILRPGAMQDFSDEEYAEFHYRQMGRLFTQLAGSAEERELSELIRPAMEYLRRAQALPYASPDVEIDIGQVMLLTGDAASARATYQTILSKAPYKAHLGLGYADLIAKSPDLESAAAHFETALAFELESAEAHIGLAKVAIARNRIIEANRHVDRALEIDPGSAEARELRELIRSR